MAKTAIQLSQMSLVTAILAEIDRQVPGAPMPPSRVLNLICESATQIVREAAIDFRESRDGMGLAAWLRSDDTGLSSLFMAHVFYGAPACDMNYPHDEADLGRCRRLIRACGPPTLEKWAQLEKYEAWLPSIKTLREEFKV